MGRSTDHQSRDGLRGISPINVLESGFELQVPPVAASAEQLLTGLQVAQNGHNESCTACGERLREGQTVSVYASQPAGKRDFEAVRVYCWQCESCFKPTLGVSELLAHATLTTTAMHVPQSYVRTLVDVSAVEYSSPAEGSKQ